MSKPRKAAVEAAARFARGMGYTSGPATDAIVNGLATIIDAAIDAEVEKYEGLVAAADVHEWLLGYAGNLPAATGRQQQEKERLIAWLRKLKEALRAIKEGA